MDKSAIEQIQLSAHIPDLIKSLDDKGLNVPTIIVPEGFCTLSLEKYMTFRSNYRAGYKTVNIADYIRYIKKFDQGGSLCMVDEKEMSAYATIDMGTVEKPLHKEHTAQICLSSTSAFYALEQINGRQLSQKEASNFVEDWSDNIKVFTGTGDFMNSKSACNSLRNLTIESARSVSTMVDDYEESMSAMEKIEAKNKDMLPSEIQFITPPYLHFEERQFNINVSIRTGGDKPTLVFRVKKVEQIKESIAIEFKDYIVDGLDGCKTEVFMGR